ncbi:serine/threonine kinase-like domain-containing protein STKLD1 [Gastrophryne carolinensis]
MTHNASLVFLTWPIEGGVAETRAARRSNSHSNATTLNRTAAREAQITSDRDLRNTDTMDKYKGLQEWDSGAFGVIQLVEEPSTGNRYAVKKARIETIYHVECIDERQCTLALEEARPLLGLQHPNICLYKEFFMTWHNQISSLSFCLVMDYWDRGSLADIVQQNRQQKKKTEEKLIQRFLGQIIDALVYIHDKELPHRNLKPSNILVNSVDMFGLSDFLPEILVTDRMKVRIRLEPEQKIFMAPESDHFIYSRKTDIWSLGCILVDLMTTPIKTEPEIVKLLQVIKTNSSGLNIILEILQGEVGYPADLCQLLPKMLTVSPEERPLAKDLVNESYIKKCLTLTGSPLAGLKKKLPPDVLDQVKHESLGGILGFMQNHIDVEDAQIFALKSLARYTGDKDDVAAKMLVGEGFLSDLKEIMENSLENKELCQSCCTLLWSLAMTECISGDSLKKAFPLIAALILKHHSDWQMVESASPALWILCLKGYVTEDQVEPVTLLLLDSLQSHMERPVLAKNVCLALTGLVINSELAAYRVLVPRAGKSGLSLLQDVYRLYSDDPEIVENICQLLNDMAGYGSTHSEMRLQHMDDMMKEIRDGYESLEALSNPAKNVHYEEKL